MTLTSGKDHDPVTGRFPARGTLAALLREGANAALRYHRGEATPAYLERRVEELAATAPNPSRTLEVVRRLIAGLDYRLAADYLRALRAGEAAVVNTFERMVAADGPTETNRLLYEVARARFARASHPGAAGDVAFVPRLEDVFSRSERGLTIYLADHALQPSLNTLLDDTGARLGSFIEQQYDLPSLNALVRQGVVRKWVLPDGTAVASKRDNPHKPGRFRTEQLNYEAILDRVSGPSRNRLLLGRTPGGAGVWLGVVRPFAIIHDGSLNRRYALSVWNDGMRLEDLLLDEGDAAARRVHLTHYRWLFDALCDRGVLWGDMSPRNIHVEQDGRDIVYHILDFEKTRLLDNSATTAERITQCRGQVCVEELGVDCLRAEVEECFRDYFAPETWDLESDAVLPFAQRPEVANVLLGRGLRDVPLGVYNRTDLEVMSVRTPDADPMTGRRRFPGHLNFKVEHYLSCADYDDAGDYDRKTTEVLIAARRHGCFDAVVAVLTEVTDRVEGDFLKAEFDMLLDAPSVARVPPPGRAIASLVRAIDALYESRASADDFRSLCRRLDSRGRIEPD